MTPDTEQRAIQAIREATALIDEITSSRKFYGIDQVLHAKLCTIRGTLGRHRLAFATPPAIVPEGEARQHVMPGDPDHLGQTALQWYLNFQFGYPHSARESNIAVEGFKDGYRAALATLPPAPVATPPATVGEAFPMPITVRGREYQVDSLAELVRLINGGARIDAIGTRATDSEWDEPAAHPEPVSPPSVEVDGEAVSAREEDRELIKNLAVWQHEMERSADELAKTNDRGLIEASNGTRKVARLLEQAGRRLAALSSSPDAVRASLKLAIDHIEHMAAWIGKHPNGYSFESLGEDWGAIKAVLSPSSPSGEEG